VFAVKNHEGSVELCMRVLVLPVNIFMAMTLIAISFIVLFTFSETSDIKG